MDSQKKYLNREKLEMMKIIYSQKTQSP